MADARRSGETKPKKRRTSSRNCCVPGCTNNDKYGIDRDNRISFHRFPKDEKLRREWIWKVRRDEGIKITSCTAVCSDHFLPSDFRKSFTGIKQDLKRGAVPSVFSFADGREETVRKSARRRNRLVPCPRPMLASDSSSDGTEVYSRSRSGSRSREGSCDDGPSIGIDIAEEPPVFFQMQNPPQDNQGVSSTSSGVVSDTKPSKPRSDSETHVHPRRDEGTHAQPMRDGETHVQPMKDSGTHVQAMRDDKTHVHIKSEPVSEDEEELTLGMKSETGVSHEEALTDVQVMGKMYSRQSFDSEKQDTSHSSSSKLCLDSEKEDSLCSSKSNFTDADSSNQFRSAPASDVEFCIHFKSEPVSDSETNEDAPSQPMAAKYADGVLEERNAEEEVLPVTVSRKRRFGEVSNNSVHKILVKDVASQKTMKKTECDIRLLRNFIAENFPEHKKTELYDMGDGALCKVLCDFFTVLKRSDGSDYEPSSLRGFVASFDRFMVANNSKKISTAKAFEKVQEVVKHRIKMMKVSRTVSVPRRAWLLSDDEVETLWKSGQLGTDNPRSMINTLWWFNTIHFGLRSVTPHRQLRWGDVTLSTDLSGRRFLTFNKTVSDTDTEGSRTKARAYENVENPERCPVELYVKYASKRPEKAQEADSPFYLACNIRPNMSPLPAEMWFKNLPTGVNTMRRIMLKMAAAAHLGKIKKISKHSF